ncbi:hypothetical protein ID866_8025 [Astraeus odoratus]|nr:hypothetical protein ID866_8025 [Astraeus odoratus]
MLWKPRPQTVSRGGSSLPSPAAITIPPFISRGLTEDEQVLKDKFRKFWMASLAEGFKGLCKKFGRKTNSLPEPTRSMGFHCAPGTESRFAPLGESPGILMDGKREIQIIMERLS